MQDGCARESHPATPNGSPPKPSRRATARTSAWIELGTSFDRLRTGLPPAGVALRAPVSTVPRSHPSMSTRASHASLQVRRRRRERHCRRRRPTGGGCARNSEADDGLGTQPPTGPRGQRHGFGGFRRQLAYKAQPSVSEVVVAERWFPSSMLCRLCGALNDGLMLKDRTLRCNGCGHREDRDLHAACNLERYPELQGNPGACGHPSAGRSVRLTGETRIDEAGISACS